jgi:sterol desaturase/sphingolipid hydroxylase (fatty acid hydroxylase superfamily)
LRVVELVLLFLLGILITEASGYLWHRSVSHAGVFKSILSDLLRRRHYDHHVHKYPEPLVRHPNYVASCDVSFRVLGVILVLAVLTVATLGLLTPLAGLTLLLSIAFHAVLASRLHALYHLSSEQVEMSLLCRWNSSRRLLFWLRSFHDVHHVVNANYSLCIPFFDMIGRTFVSPRALGSLQREDLFPGFDGNLSSSCGERLL